MCPPLPDRQRSRPGPSPLLPLGQALSPRCPLCPGLHMKTRLTVLYRTPNLPSAPSVTGRDPQGIVGAQSLRADSSCDCKSAAYLEGTVLHETSRTEKDKHRVVSLIHRLLKKNRSQAHRNRGLWLPEAPGEAGLPASATPRAFCPSVVKNVRLPGKATRGEDGVRAYAAPPSAAWLLAQTSGLGPPVRERPPAGFG